METETESLEMLSNSLNYMVENFVLLNYTFKLTLADENP
jgi:hypothetical protein